jgi:hypothetical protein
VNYLAGERPLSMCLSQWKMDRQGERISFIALWAMKMLDTLQNTQLQSAIVKAMYAATIESEMDTQTAMDFILGADNPEQTKKLTGWLGKSQRIMRPPRSDLEGEGTTPDAQRFTESTVCSEYR